MGFTIWTDTAGAEVGFCAEYACSALLAKLAKLAKLPLRFGAVRGTSERFGGMAFWVGNKSG